MAYNIGIVINYTLENVHQNLPNVVILNKGYVFEIVFCTSRKIYHKKIVGIKAL
jgi:hypothetical protein